MAKSPFSFFQLWYPLWVSSPLFFSQYSSLNRQVGHEFMDWYTPLTHVQHTFMPLQFRHLICRCFPSWKQMMHSQCFYFLLFIAQLGTIVKCVKSRGRLLCWYSSCIKSGEGVSLEAGGSAASTGKGLGSVVRKSSNKFLGLPLGKVRAGSCCCWVGDTS